MQILVVEDDVRLAQALCRILEESGYKTDAVHDGQSGLDYAETAESVLTTGRWLVII